MYLVLSIAIFVLPYLLGSIATAVWVSKGMYGVDIRTVGSLNAGSTNMFRDLGMRAGVITQVVDILKGSLAAALPWFIFWIFPNEPHLLSGWTMEMQSITCGMLAVIGHIYPIFAGFRGGKGINTLLGMMLVTNPIAALVCLAAWILILYVTRYVAVASMLGVGTYPLYILILGLVNGGALNTTLILLGIAMFLLVVFTHRSNIRNLMQGTEGKNPWFDGKVQ
ncbi:MAG: glycerol-3-phosphate 1-O-acyltransferase PlsY [Bacteroidota bacterium]